MAALGHVRHFAAEAEARGYGVRGVDRGAWPGAATPRCPGRLRGRALACWCALDASRCHADVLARVAMTTTDADIRWEMGAPWSEPRARAV
jgi:hypothetical protein